MAARQWQTAFWSCATQTLHGTISFSIQQTKLAANVGKTRAVKNKMPLIPAQSAAAEMPGDGWSCKPTLFDWQSMRPHAELHQQPQSGNGHWNLKLCKIWHSPQLTGAQKPSKICAELGPLGGSCSWGDMQTSPNPREFRHAMPEDENGEAMPRGLYCLTMPSAQLSHEGCCWASATLSPRISA